MGSRTIAFAALAWGLSFAAAAQAGEASAQQGQAASDDRAGAQAVTLERARAALLRGDVDEAERLLAGIDPALGDINDIDFLEGTLAVAKGRYMDGVARFKAILARNPSLNRVRLDLARAYFLARDDLAADHYFRAALAQGVPLDVQENIEKFLDQIRRRRRWAFSASGAVAPDTNINAATAAQTIDLFGVPFDLNQNARQTSGVGFTGDVAGSYQWDIGSPFRLKTGGAYDDTEYGNSAYSDRILNLYAGPTWLLGNTTTVSALATGGARWYGGHPLYDNIGGRLEADSTLTPHILVSGAIDARQLTYADPYEDYTGPVISATGQLTYAPDAISFIRGQGGVVREQTRLSAYRDWQYIVGGGYYRERLPFDLAMFVGVQASVIRYDAALAAFAVTRHDVEIDYRVSLSDKKIDVLGFTPVVSYIHVDRYSNIDLFAYHRNRGEIGVTRNF